MATYAQLMDVAVDADILGTIAKAISSLSKRATGGDVEATALLLLLMRDTETDSTVKLKHRLEAKS